MGRLGVASTVSICTMAPEILSLWGPVELAGFQSEAKLGQPPKLLPVRAGARGKGKLKEKNRDTKSERQKEERKADQKERGKRKVATGRE